MSSKRSPSPGSFGAADPGVRDEGVQRLVERSLHGGLVADVDRPRRRAVDHVAEARLVAGEQRQPRAFGCEPLCDRAPDAGPGAGDDDVLPLEAIHAGESTGCRAQCRTFGERGVTIVSTATL